jgi:cytidylate kinase
MNDRVKILGLAGTNGAGKDSVGALLAEHYGYYFFSLTELFREECRRRGIPVIRENTRMVSEEWRRESGLATLVDRSMAVFEAAGGLQKYKGFVMSSLRNPYEADRVHELGGSVIWIDADPHVRYERIQKNAAARGRSGEDNRTFAQFLQEEQDEMYPPAGADAAALYGAAVKERADIFLGNDTDSLDSLRLQIGTVLGIS